jgi:hypothetical protein
MIPAHLQNRTIDQLKSTQETIRCFIIKPVGEGYESIITTEDGDCVGGFKYHRTEKIIARFQLESDNTYPKGWIDIDERLTKVPTYCSRCDNHEFSEEARNKISGSKGRVWEREDTGERADNVNDFGPGAMWYATWYINEEDKLYWHPGFGHYSNPPLYVRTPGGDWNIDGRATNCTLPDDNNHRCWPHSGEAPNVTVDLSLGPTCHCGGGSIITGDYHGFLRNGYLVKC